MAKKNNGTNIGLIIGLCILAVIALDYFNVVNLGITHPVVAQQIVTTTTTPSGSSTTQTTGYDVCGTMTQNYPTYVAAKELQCGMAGGTWICEHTKAGCYQVSTWDYINMCPSDDVQKLKAACTVVGGTWTCTATQISCEL